MPEVGFVYFLFMREVRYSPRNHMRRRITQQHQQMREKGRAMSLNFVAGVDFASQLPTATAPYFLLGLSSTGAWVIRETAGRRAGLFSSREAAIRFAREESVDGNFTIVHCPEGLELEGLRFGQAA